jgi:hypothetical protein
MLLTVAVDRALLHLGYLVGQQTVRLAVHGLCGLLVRGLRQAEDLAGVFVEPILEVPDPLLALDLLVLPVGVGYRLGGESLDVLVVVHEHRHRAHLLLFGPLPLKVGPSLSNATMMPRGRGPRIPQMSQIPILVRRPSENAVKRKSNFGEYPFHELR